MNLIALYDSLEIPHVENTITFNAKPIPEYTNFRIAVDFEGKPVLLLSIGKTIKNIELKNIRLKYLQLEQNIECKISENGKNSFNTFTVITFTSTDRNLQEYFLRISETLVKTLSNKLTQKKVIESLNKFVEVFRTLSDIPTNTVHGLWTELFLIENSSNPKILLDYWHYIPEEKFDFNSGEEKIEVKSNSNFERLHTFSSEQLNPPAGTKVLIASIFIRQNNAGKSIQNLVDSIASKVQHDVNLVEKLNNIVCRSLGNSLEQTIMIKYDYKIAKESLLYYNQNDIKKIEELNIPNEVSHVKYISDLSDIKDIQIVNLKYKNQLFKSL